MRIESIHIHNFRNIKAVSIQPNNNINIITGSNGAGKSSLIESIYFLARGKSFRTSNIKKLINNKANHFQISGHTQNSIGLKQSIRINTNRQHIEINISGKKIKKLSLLAHNLPLGIITPSIHKILEEGPVNRRKLLNWGVFHVEQKYSRLMRQYNKVLLQRNCALRSNSDNWVIWNKPLCDLAEQINQIRKDYVRAWNEHLTILTQDFNAFKDLKIKLNSGWSQDKNLSDILEEREDIDKRKGYTTNGIHRADLCLTISNQSIKDLFSRGQQKFVGFLLIFSQLKLLSKRMHEDPILLIDDFTSELDSKSISHMISIITDSGFQSFLTVLTDSPFLHTVGEEVSVFHVEQGDIH